MYSGMQQAADHSVDNTIIDNRFLRKANETYERYVFNTRRQKAHETVDDYIAVLCSLASTCNFCDCLKDSLLRDRVVLGIKDSSIRKRLLQEADLNLETCIVMCRAAEATSPSQPVKTVTWTEDTTAVQAGSVSGDQRPGKKRDFSQSLRRCDPTASPDEAEMSGDDSDDDTALLQWNPEHQSSDLQWNRAERSQKQEPAWSMEEDSPDQPSAVYSTAQLMSDNTSGSLLSLNTSHVCRRCSAAFVLVSSLELHLASVHGEKLYMVLPGSSTPDRCDAGDYKVSDTVGKRSIRPHVCNVCNKAFKYAGHLKNHRSICDAGKYSDSDWEPGSLRKKQTKRKTKIDDRDKIGKKFHGLKLHMVLPGSSSSSTPDRCDAGDCDNTDKDKEADRQTKRETTTEGDDNVAGDKDGRNRNKKHVCDICEKCFRAPSGLKRHKLIHSGVKPFVCEVCSKSFIHAGNLKQHKIIHTGERPYKCPHCSSAFIQLGSLQDHISAVHEGIRPHLCDVCGAAFSHKHHLTVHKRIHTGEKPYVCSDCGKRFAQTGELASHRLTHTGEKPFMCSDCGKGFTQSNDLTRHCLTHSGLKPHRCALCPSAFRRSHHLKRHVKNKHQPH